MKSVSNIRKKATIYDIAKEAGTSAATVSRVLSECGYPVRHELRQNVLNVAKKLNYKPNIIGRMLKSSISRDIGVIIPTISNPFYPQILLGIELEARHQGYNILLCNSLRDPVTERKYIETLCQKQVTGLIISLADENYGFLKEVQEQGVSIVILDRDTAEQEYSRIGFDYVKGGMIGTEYLIGLGHSNIAFLASPLTKKSRTDTFEGFRLAHKKHDIGIRDENIIVSEKEEESGTGTYEFENGKRLAERFIELDDRPSAIFAINDMTALGVMQRLLEKGIRVPEDVSVMGFDNIEISSMVNPPLTTVNQPSYETGNLACKILIDKIKQRSSGNVSVMLEPALVLRRSVSALPEK